MTKKIIYQESFLVSGIMCHQGCGAKIEGALKHLEALKKEKLLPEDAELIVNAEPAALGIHRLLIIIESDSPKFFETERDKKKLSDQFKKIVSKTGKGFEIIDTAAVSQKNKSQKTNWINIAINILAIITILALSLVFPPSLPLTIGLLALSIFTTAFTARSYLINFYHNLRKKNLANMSTTITLGWLLSLGHSLYHAISMPMITGFSMIFMNFIMPVILITLVNGMDEIKRLILNKSKKMHLSSLKKLFPQMAEEYLCYPITPMQEEELTQHIKTGTNTDSSDEINAISLSIQNLLHHVKQETQKKSTLKKNSVITVKTGECFPVDGIIIQGSTLIDASILTGEPQQYTRFLDFIPAGSVNLSHEVTLYAQENCYNSTVNKLLFRSNRAPQDKPSLSSDRLFSYWYAGLIILGIAASILAPFALGVFAIPLVIQNITGILFTICPCTIAIAHQLPKLLSNYQRNNKGIILRNEQLTEESDEVEIIVFDKTGTLTTGNSEVDCSEGISDSLWQRIYLLEKLYGTEHPLAKAIYHYYENKGGKQSVINDVTAVSRDIKNRGLSARVQGKRIHIGSADYMARSDIALPTIFSAAVQKKIEQGYTVIYVAEDNKYQGLILIKHEIEHDVLESLKNLKKAGKKIIMLTGDTQLAATGFNQQNDNLFEPKNIHAEATPQGKEDFLKKLMAEKTINPKSVWFVGDGLNDAPCARIVTEKGGISFAMRSDDKASFFADISLNGSLSYLFKHNQLNQFLKKSIAQNKGLLSYSAIIFLAFIITFSIAGIAVSPLIPMTIMTLTTLFTVFNCYRSKLAVDCALDKKPSWIKQYLVSNISIGLLVTASSLFAVSLLISTAITGGLTLPTIIFTAGALAAATSACVLTAGIMLGVFAILGVSYLIINHYRNTKKNTVPSNSVSDCAVSKNEQPPRSVLQKKQPAHASLIFEPLHEKREQTAKVELLSSNAENLGLV